MDMKAVAVLAITLWTISSPVLGALRVGDCSQETDGNAWCADSTDGDVYSECVGIACACTSAYKLDTDCVEKGLTDACTAPGDCTVGVTDAVCTADVCACPSLYKFNVGSDACIKVLGSACTGTDCDVLSHATCDTNCVCSPGYKTNTDTTNCEKVYDMTCANDAECTVNSNTGYKCVTDKCACKDDYALKDNVCVMKVTATTCGTSTPCTATNAECKDGATKCSCKTGFKESANTCVVQNGASGMTSKIGLMSVILMVFSYIIKY